MTLTSNPSDSPAARAIDLAKTYGTGEAAVRALDGVNLEFERGRFTAVMGPSGSGKSTLMHCMAGLDGPTRGRSFMGEEDLGRLDDARSDRSAARPRRVHVPVVQPRPHAHRGARTSRCRSIWAAQASTGVVR